MYQFNNYDHFVRIETKQGKQMYLVFVHWLKVIYCSNKLINFIAEEQGGDSCSEIVCNPIDFSTNEVVASNQKFFWWTSSRLKDALEHLPWKKVLLLGFLYAQNLKTSGVQSQRQKTTKQAAFKGRHLRGHLQKVGVYNQHKLYEI